MTDRMDPKLRELTYRLIEMAPEAPPFPDAAVVELDLTPPPAAGARQRPLVWVAVAAVVALLIVGVPLVLFGPGSGSSPTTIAPASQTTPEEVAPTTAPDDVSVTTGPIAERPVVSFSAYLFSEALTTQVGDPVLVAIERSQAVDESVAVTPELTVALAIESLLGADPEPGYTTAVPPGSELISGEDLGDGVVAVNLPAAFESGGGTSSMTARLAQVVFTATQVPEVDSVLFLIDGEVVEVFSSEGLLLDGPQRRADYFGTGQEFYVDTPAIGSIISGTVGINGHAKTADGTVQVEIMKQDGTPINGGLATISCGAGCWGQFAAAIPYTLDEDTDGFVTVGHPASDERVSYPVTLLAAEWSGPPEDPAVPATADEIALMESVAAFALSRTPEDFAAIPLADEVALGLGAKIVRTVSAAELADPDAWVMDIDLFRARSGTTSIFTLLEGDPARRTVTGDHVHCASPPVPAPAGFQELIRISTQPIETTTCLEWFTIDLYVDDTGEISAITIDLYEP